MYGLGNWAEVAEHVGTKNKEQCINHYTNVYLNSPHFPRPVRNFDMNQIQFLFVRSCLPQCFVESLKELHFTYRTCLMLMGKIEMSFLLWQRKTVKIQEVFVIVFE